MISNSKRQCTRLRICENHLQAFVEFGALEERFKAAQRLHIIVLRTDNKNSIPSPLQLSEIDLIMSVEVPDLLACHRHDTLDI